MIKGLTKCYLLLFGYICKFAIVLASIAYLQMDNEQKIRKMEALVSLIDEPDDVVFADISRSIESYGSEIIPFLEQAWENQHLSVLQKRIEELIHVIQFDKVYEDLDFWIREGGKDLLEGCLIIARYQYPNLKEHEIEYELSKIRKDVWLELNDNLTALEQVKVFNYIFYEVHGFHGNTENYHAPENSYLNKVLETRSGNPLAMSIIYMLIAQGLDMPIKGINLPEHFVVAYTGASIDPDTLEYKANNVLFYINVFSRGTVFSFKDVELFFKQLKQEPNPLLYNPCKNIDIILRMTNNLFLAYDKTRESSKAAEIKKLIKLFETYKQKETGQRG